MESKIERRSGALDALRGITIFLMIPVNAGLDFAGIPSWWKHAPQAGMNFADFIMPTFLVALGLSSSFSLRKRLDSDGLAKTVLHALFRYALLFIFGTIGFFLVWHEQDWEVLQMLGATGAFAFPFLFLPPLPRALAALVIVGLVEFLRPAFFEGAYRFWYESGLGGPAGTFALASLPIAASALGEALRGHDWKKRALASAGAGIVLIALGLLAGSFQAPSKHLLTPAYLMISGGAAFVALALLEAVCSAVADLPLFGPIGRNALFGYMFSGVLILLARSFVPADAAPFLAWSTAIGITLITSAIILVMDRLGIWVKL